MALKHLFEPFVELGTAAQGAQPLDRPEDGPQVVAGEAAGVAGELRRTVEGRAVGTVAPDPGGGCRPAASPGRGAR